MPDFPRLALALALLALPTAALAHAAERMVILTLPTRHYLIGAAAAILITALVGAYARRLPRIAPRKLRALGPARPAGAVSWIAFAALVLLVATGFLGTRDPLGNPLVLAIWTGLWVALPLLTLVLGNIWRDISPWTAPVRAARRALGRTGSAGIARLGYWPAAAGFFGFAWFEIVSLAPSDPAVLARAVTTYYVVVFALAVLEGEAWLDRGEAFTVYFGFLARIAPFWTEGTGTDCRLMAGLPGAQILAMPPLPPSAIAFVTLVLAAVSFDGLSETFWWLARLGINPLEFPGRSAVMQANTLGLIAAWALTVAALLGTIALGRKLDRDSGAFWPDAGRYMLSFLPISAGYHTAHYLVVLLTQGQYVMVALDDPLGCDWHLLGLPHNWVSFAFLNDPGTVRLIWNIQFAVILGAHLLAVILSMRLSAPARPAAHLPMTVLMVLYTIFGLWLLSSATAT